MNARTVLCVLPMSCLMPQCACAGVVSNTVEAAASVADSALTGAGKAAYGVFDAVDPRSPNMLSFEMREEKFYDQPIAFQTNLLRLASCANAAYPGVAIPRGYRPFTDAAREALRPHLRHPAGERRVEGPFHRHPHWHNEQDS